MQNHTNKRKVFNLETLGVKRCKNFGYYNYYKVQPKLETHLHKDIIEICFCLKGQQFYEINGNLIKMNGNDILIVPPNAKHSTGVYPEDIGELYWLQIYVYKNKHRLCNLIVSQSKYLLNLLLTKSNTIIKGAYKLKPLLEQLMFEVEKNKTIIGVIKTNQLILQIILEIITLAEIPQPTIKSKKHKMIDDFILENNYRNIYVDELATLINVSTSYFKYWFKQTIGMPPKEYVNRLKIEKAKEKLLKEKKVTNIAFDLGFNTSQYFATSFKKHTGLTPKEYIAQNS